ncbi:hypothetical protein [Cohnella sp. GCM10012308]|uniref:hypothetical protein n=1 Tax=Cohnella sp. GCM10012308 TaxID=3317329 RepID=UPI00361A9B97
MKFESDEWERLKETRRGVNEFTVARPHSIIDAVSVPTVCLIQGNNQDGSTCLYIGLLDSRKTITTLDSRLKIKRSLPINPNTIFELIQLVAKKNHKSYLQKKLDTNAPVVLLSPKLSSYLIRRIASIETNLGPMRTVAESLSVPKAFDGPIALQEDAVRMALKAFGLSTSDQAQSLELVEGKNTSLARVSITEDSVIEHDARKISGYDLAQSDLTGRAIFKKDGQWLEVFTANRRPLEHVFGVDLIYLNVIKQNIVMIQYKMLEPNRTAGNFDWIYRPDVQLNEEMKRMQKFNIDHAPGKFEYRLNPGIFYLKFVKRDGSMKNSSIITPIEHFEKICIDPSYRGPKNGLIISYDKLSGCYLRESTFLDLIHSGYIGGHSTTTNHLRTLIEEVLKNDRAVVAAIQSSVKIE